MRVLTYILVEPGRRVAVRLAKAGLVRVRRVARHRCSRDPSVRPGSRVCEAWETTRRELCCTYMFVAHHSQLIEQPCDHQRQGWPEPPSLRIPMSQGFSAIPFPPFPSPFPRRWERFPTARGLKDLQTVKGLIDKIERVRLPS